MLSQTILGLREKPDETWQHFFTDELVYAAEPIKIEPDIQSSELECYVNPDVQITVRLWFSAKSYAVAIFKCASGTENSGESTNPNHALHETRDDSLVFVNTIDFMQPPQMLNCRPLLSMVWLKTFDDGVNYRVDIPEFRESSTSGILEITGRVKDGKFRATTRLIAPSVQQGKLPGQVVQGRAHIEGNIPNQGAPRHRRSMMDLEPEDLLKVFRLILWDDRTWIQIPETKDIGLERIEVSVGPFKLQPYTVQGVHKVS